MVTYFVTIYGQQVRCELLSPREHREHFPLSPLCDYRCNGYPDDRWGCFRPATQLILHDGLWYGFACCEDPAHGSTAWRASNQARLEGGLGVTRGQLDNLKRALDPSE